MTTWLSYLLAYGPALLLLVLVGALFLRARKRRERARRARQRLTDRGPADDAGGADQPSTPDP